MQQPLFAPLCELQLPSHCGPCSLSACLFILGTSATQRQLAAAAGRSIAVFAHGVDEQGLRRAARKFGVDSEFVMHARKDQGAAFAQHLRRHLKRGNPAIMLCRHFEHWVAVIGYLPRARRFIVVDPKEPNAVFFRWSEQTLLRHAWNAAETDERRSEPDQYFAILLSRHDGVAPRWRISDAWLRLCERGSADTAESMASDLAEMAALASPESYSVEAGPFLAEILEAYESCIIDSITHWATGNDRLTRVDLRTFYRDYLTVASSTGIRISPDTDQTALVVQIAVLLCSYWWGARF